MSLINGALQIGRSAVSVSQAALAVTGNNMANAATSSYSRQTVHLAPTQYTEVVPGQYTGTGVAILEIRRQVDEALNSRIRTAVGDSASNLVQQQAMTRVEATFNELTDEDLSSRLNEFFTAWSALQNQPEDVASRSVVMQEGDSLANFMRELRGQIKSIQDDLDSQVRFQVDEANALADQVAALNQQVVSSEAGQAGSAAALRDQRDDLLKQLSELVNITTREVDGGAVNVFIGNEPLIQYSSNRGLSYQESEDLNGNWLAEVVFTDNEQSIDLASGKIHGLITARDEQLGSILNDVDSWSSSLIFEINKIHSLGQGLEKFSSVSSEFRVEDATVSLGDREATGLNWQVNNGVFYVNVTDENTGNTTSQMIKVNVGMDANDTTLTSLAADLNSIDGITAYVDSGNRLQIEGSASNYKFTFSASDNSQGTTTSENTTNVLAVLGINTFFSGSNGNDIEVDSDLNARGIAASANGLAGNGEVAGQIAQLATDGVSSLDGISLIDSYNSLVGKIAADSKAAQDNYTAADVVAQTLESERQSISGVSMDEEAIHMIMYQRAFQGAARYISIIDQMLDEVVSLVS
jgi:flagellar hook-associated protein 1